MGDESLMLLGAIIGDIIGSAYEFNNVKTKNFELMTPESTFTDDSVMTMAVANALTQFKKGSEIDESEFKEVLIDTMHEFGRIYPGAGYGSRFKKWLRSGSRDPYKSYGNGSAMRVSPVAWYFDDLDTVERFAKLSAEVTHNHPEGIKGAQAIAAAIFLARTGKSKAEIESYIRIKYNYNLNRTLDEIRPDYEFDETCQGSVSESIIAFLESDSFEDTIRNAVSIGGDSDTVACMAASIAQGMWGNSEELEKLVMPALDSFMLDENENFWSALNGADKDNKPVEKFKNNITEMVFILDRSGSMSGLEGDTIGGFNSLIEKQKQEPGEAIVSTILFDNVQEVLHDRVKISDIQKMTEDEYFTRGSTALLDAIGGAINHISRIYKHSKPEEIPEYTNFVIITDGYENASRRFTGRQIKRMIEHEKNKYGWEFLFIGANIDAITAAQDLGISRDMAVDYIADSQGTGKVFESVSRAMSCNRRSMSIAPDWSASIAEDYDLRMPQQTRRGRGRKKAPEQN